MQAHSVYIMYMHKLDTCTVQSSLPDPMGRQILCYMYLVWNTDPARTHDNVQTLDMSPAIIPHDQHIIKCGLKYLDGPISC